MSRIIIALLMFALLVLAVPNTVSADTNNYQACWGQATAVFAATGQMGQHSSQQPTPRMGLANLAQLLYDQGDIPEPTIQALGVYVVSLSPELTVDACMEE